MARVLVVEDNETDRLFLRTALERGGHEVLFAKEGEEGFKTFLRSGVDVVVTDLQMPNVDGLRLIEELLALFPDAPIIAVSGKGKSHLDMARMTGARAALPKPVDPAALVAAVEAALEGG